MTGSASKRWTLYWHCFSQRFFLENRGGVWGGEGNKLRLMGGLADDGKRNAVEMDVVLALLLAEKSFCVTIGGEFEGGRVKSRG